MSSGGREEAGAPAPEGWGGRWPASVLATSLGHAALDDAREMLQQVTGGAAPGPGLETAGGDGVGDVYQQLMARERRVLDTVDRVVNDAAQRDRRARSFLHLPLHEVGMRAMAAARGLLDDLSAARSPRDAYAALTHPGRAVYLGVLLLLLAMCAAFVHATT